MLSLATTLKMQKWNTLAVAVLLAKAFVHVIGLLYTLHFQKLNKKSVPPIIASTSKPQQWHISKRKGGIKPRPAIDVVVQKSKKKPLKPSKKKRVVDGTRSTIYRPFQHINRTSCM